MSIETARHQDDKSAYVKAGGSSGDSQYFTNTQSGRQQYGSYESEDFRRKGDLADSATVIWSERATKAYRNGSMMSQTSVGANEENGQSQNDLWSNILNSVKSSRAVPVKNVIILGDEKTGKSTLLSYLMSSSSSSSVSNYQNQDNSNDEAADLGLGYSYFDVGDEDGEDVIARIGVFQASSSHPSHLSLLPLTVSTLADTLPNTENSRYDPLSRKSSVEEVSNAAKGSSTRAKPSVEALKDSLFLITLDWEAPWTFLAHLLEWLEVIRDIVESAAASTGKGKYNKDIAAYEELKDSIEFSIRSYKDPSGPASFAAAAASGEEVGETSIASAIVPVSNPTANEGDERMPLPEGSLTHNFGVPIVIVCTKADTIAQLEKDRNFDEEKIDYIQQVLRTISLKYGAGLFFTAQSRPSTFEILRSYILHRLFSTHTQTSSERSFSFSHRPSTVDKDTLVVPAGWDSFGKIRALRDGFDCAGMANGWEWDSQVEQIRRRQKLPKGSRQAEEIADQQVDRRSLQGLIEDDRSGVESTVKLYEAIVEDWDANIMPLSNQAGDRVKEPDEQSFLLHHFTTLQKETNSKSKLPSQNSNSTQGLQQTTSMTNGRSIVGPMGSSSLSLPSVERVIQERQLSEDGKTSKITPSSRSQSGKERDRERHREKDRSTTSFRRADINSSIQSPSLNSNDKGESSRPTSPLSSVQAAGGQTPKQSEVLHSFFQSLLKDKNTGGSNASSRSSGTRTHATSDRDRDRDKDRERKSQS